MQEKLHILQGS